MTKAGAGLGGRRRLPEILFQALSRLLCGPGHIVEPGGFIPASKKRGSLVGEGRRDELVNLAGF